MTLTFTMVTVKRLVRYLAAAALALGFTSAHAIFEGPGRNPTPGELALLPVFCQDVQTINGWEQHVRESPRAPMWISKMGKAFWHMHHYCWARNAIHRSQVAGIKQQYREFLIRAAINDMQYVVERSDLSNAMLPEIYYLMGDYNRMLRRYADAIAMFQKSREVKADYWPPYAGEADLLLMGNQRAKARALLQQGLKIMPNEVALRSRIDKLGAPLSSAGSSAGANEIPNTAIP